MGLFCVENQKGEVVTNLGVGPLVQWVKGRGPNQCCALQLQWLYLWGLMCRKV